MTRLLSILCLWLLLAAPALAAVRIDFYSRDTDVRFPHALVALQGTTADGAPIDANYGFTPYSLTPLALLGPVDGHVVSVEPDYLLRARLHFSMVLDDDEYARVMAVVERWRARPQPSYSLDTANCVTFVAEIAAALGLDVSDLARFVRRPTSFLRAAAARNGDWLAARATALQAAQVIDPAPGTPAPSRGSAVPSPRPRRPAGPRRGFRPGPRARGCGAPGSARRSPAAEPAGRRPAVR